MTIFIILLLILIILILSLGLLFFIKKSVYFSDKEKEYLLFIIDIFSNYGDELGIQTKEQHNLLVDELNKIKNKQLK